MAAYYLNEAAFSLPDRPFVDRTVHVLEAPLPDGDALGVLVMRRRIAEGKSLRETVDEHLADDAKRLAGFALIDRAEATVAGAPAILVCGRWRHSGKILYQRQAHLALGWAWVFFAANAPLSAREACDEAFEGILGSLVLRDG
jgi:hypothetical protein